MRSPNDDLIRIIYLMKESGVDLWHVSSGGIAPVVYGITTPEMAESVIAGGHADMLALGRVFLRNPCILSPEGAFRRRL